MKVITSGAVGWGEYPWVFIRRGAIGRYVGAQEVDTGIWNIYYRNVLVGYTEEEKYLKKEQYQSFTPRKV